MRKIKGLLIFTLGLFLITACGNGVNPIEEITNKGIIRKLSSRNKNYLMT